MANPFVMRTNVNSVPIPQPQAPAVQSANLSAESLKFFLWESFLQNGAASDTRLLKRQTYITKVIYNASAASSRAFRFLHINSKTGSQYANFVYLNRYAALLSVQETFYQMDFNPPIPITRA